MFTQLFKFKAPRDLQHIKKGLQEQTGENDFLGFEDSENQNEYLQKAIQEGFIEFDGDYVIINADTN